MKIELETKHDVGDLVYIIHECNRYNDYYSNETMWEVLDDGEHRNNETPFEIENIIIKQYEKKAYISYEFKNIVTNELNMFYNAESALEECRIRNI